MQMRVNLLCCLITMALALGTLGNAVYGQKKITISNQVAALNDSIWYYRNNDPTQAITFAKKAIALHKADTSFRNRAKSYISLGVVYDLKFMEDSAMYYYHLAEQITKKGKLRDMEASVYNNIGLVYWNQGDYKQALDFYFKTLKISEEINDTLRIGRSANNIGLVFHDLGDYKKAKQYHLKAVHYFTLLDEKYDLGAALNNLGNDYHKTNKDSALIVLQQAIRIQESINDHYGLGKSYNNYGSVLDDFGKRSEAILNFERGLANHRKAHNQNGIAGSLHNLAVLYELSDNVENRSLALAYLQECKQITMQTGNKQILFKAYFHLAKMYNHQGLYQKAYDELLSSYRVHQELYDEDLAQQSITLEKKYNLAKKENEILQLKVDNATKKTEINKKKAEQKLIIFIAVAALLLVLSVALYFIYRQRLAAQKKNAEREKAQFKAVLDAEQKERFRIARDLHDSIGQMLSVVKMNVSNIHYHAAEQEKKETENTLVIIDKTIQEVRHISHNLIPEELNFGIVNALEEMCERVNAANSTAVKCIIDDNIKEVNFTKQFELSLYRIVQEVIGNMLKHAEAKTILINMVAEENYSKLTIKDDGKGFDTNLINNSTGLGWKNILARISLLNGKFEIQSNNATGTQIDITLPK